jgi:1-phosphofructokinase family hexose kinase
MVVVAGKNGRALVRGLKKEGLPFSAFELSSGEMRANRTLIEESTGRVKRIIGAGPRWSEKDRQAFRVFFSRQLDHARVLVLSGRLPTGMSVSFFAELIREANSRGIAVFLDTSGMALKAGIGAWPMAVKPNQEEAEEFLGYRLSSRRAVRNALQSFLECGMKMVLLTLGERGLAVAQGKRFYLVRTPRIQGGHAVGCGDAALAGFIAGWQRRQDLAVCARLAAACGTASMLSDVPAGITKKAVRSVSARSIIERL